MGKDIAAIGCWSMSLFAFDQHSAVHDLVDSRQRLNLVESRNSDERREAALLIKDRGGGKHSPAGRTELFQSSTDDLAYCCRYLNISPLYMCEQAAKVQAALNLNDPLFQEPFQRFQQVERHAACLPVEPVSYLFEGLAGLRLCLSGALDCLQQLCCRLLAQRG